MKILLTNLPGPYCRAGSRWPHLVKDKKLGYNPFPFFLAYATSVLLKNGYDTDIKDCIALNWNEEKFFSYIRESRPGVVVIETSTPSYYYDINLAKKIDAIKVAVGSHATVTFEQHLKDGFDYVAIGEYDFSLLELIKFLEKKRTTIPNGIASKGKLNVKHAELIKDIDILPWPAWHLMPMEKYSDPILLGRNVSVLSSRGCLMRCNFCNIALFFGNPNFRTRKPERVCDEIDFLISKYKPDEFYFDDDLINISKEHLLNLCKEIKKRNFGIPWSCMGDAKIEPELLETMADAGCRMFKFGAESGDNEVLKMIPKRITTDDIIRTVKKCKEVGIKTHATYVFGLPGENIEKAKKTIKFALDLDTDTLQFAIVIPYPGTKLYKMAEENGWLVTKDWSRFNAGSTSVLNYPEYSAKEIEEVHRMAWNAWDKHLIKKPKTVFHHLYGVYRRDGLLQTLSTILWSCKRVIKGI